MLKKHTKNYLKTLTDSLNEKLNLSKYEYYNEMIDVRVKYIDIYNLIHSKYDEVKVDVTSPVYVFDYIFSASTHFFNELMDCIILSKYDSAHYSIRRISENYIILSFLNENQDCISDFSKQVILKKYKTIRQNKYIRSKLTEEEILLIEEQYKSIENEVLEFYSLRNPLSRSQQNKINDILGSDYFFAYKKISFGNRITLKKIAGVLGLEKDYTSFSNSSNRVHSNNIFEYTLIMTRDFNEEIYLGSSFYEYISKYTLILSLQNTEVDYSDLNSSLVLLDNAIKRIERVERSNY